MSIHACPSIDVYVILKMVTLNVEAIALPWFAGQQRKRSKFGMWLDEKELSQLEMSRRSGVSQPTVNALATGDVHKPTRLTSRKLLKAIQEIDPDVEFGDLWG